MKNQLFFLIFLFTATIVKAQDAFLKSRNIARLAMATK
jgi:hypothetical protein